MKGLAQGVDELRDQLLGFWPVKSNPLVRDAHEHRQQLPLQLKNGFHLLLPHEHL